MPELAAEAQVQVGKGRDMFMDIRRDQVYVERWPAAGTKARQFRVLGVLPPMFHTRPETAGVLGRTCRKPGKEREQPTRIMASTLHTHWELVR
jgi:hypothetical protein